MEQFAIYFQIGREHILDLGMGLDHILFVVALAAGYLLGDWKKILVLVTAFTVGHSITLALATLQIIRVRTDVVEFAIVVTIFIAAVSNLFKKQAEGKVPLNYLYALFFGLIHGLGFSNTLRALLMKTESLTMPLLAFNLGLELGQVVIVAAFLAISVLVVNVLAADRRDWRMIVSSAIAGIALMLVQERVFW